MPVSAEQPADCARVYVSYAWNGDSKAVFARLKAACAEQGISVRSDTEVIGYRGSIADFMAELGRGRAVILVLSDDYLRSPNCMRELLEVRRNADFHRRVYPVVVRGTRFYEARERIPFVKHWEQQSRQLQADIAALDRSDHLTNIRAEHDLFNDIRTAIDDLLGLLGDMNALTQDAHEQTDFADLIAALKAAGCGAVPAAVATLPAAPADFDPAFAERIEEALKSPKCAPLRKALQQQVQGPGAATLGETLLHMDGTDALMAFRTAAHRCRETVGDRAWSASLLPAARKVAGWLLARLVRAVRPDNPLAVEIRVGTEEGAEVLWVHWQGRGQPPEFRVIGSRLVGQHHLLGAKRLAETGWEQPDATVALVKDALRERYPRARDDRDLAERLAIDASSIGAPFYVTVDRARPNDPLNDPQVQAALQRELRLPVLYIEAPDEPLFALEEQTLRNLIDACIETLESERP